MEEPTDGASYRVKTHDDIHTTIRLLHGKTISEVVDKAFKLYYDTWDKFPDFADLEKNKYF